MWSRRGSSIIHAESDGFVTSFLPSQAQVVAEGPVLVDAMNPALEAENRSLTAERRSWRSGGARRYLKEIAAAQILDEQLAALEEKIARVQQELSLLHLTAPCFGHLGLARDRVRQGPVRPSRARPWASWPIWTTC